MILTPAERKVCLLVANGDPNSEIAGKLTITEHTVKFHISQVLKRYGFRNRVELAVAIATNQNPTTIGATPKMRKCETCGELLGRGRSKICGFCKEEAKTA